MPLRGDEESMRRSSMTMLMLAAFLAATGARASVLEIPPPGKPKELSVYVNPPPCTRWTDECVSCTRGADGKGPACSNIGFACQPKAIRCIGADIPRDEQQKK